MQHPIIQIIQNTETSENIPNAANISRCHIGDGGSSFLIILGLKRTKTEKVRNPLESHLETMATTHWIEILLAARRSYVKLTG